MSLMTEITIFVLAAFVGFEVISKVPTTLHTPLMSQTNAIHGIVMLGGLIVIGSADDTLEKVIGVIAIAFGTINIVGGFMVTDRMLGMFGGRKPEAEDGVRAGDRDRRGVRSVTRSVAALSPNSDFVTACYIVAFSLFIFGIRQGTHPTHRQARQPDRRRRDGGRGRDHALARRDRQLGPDPDRHPDRDRRRRRRLAPGADDRRCRRWSPSTTASAAAPWR